MLKEIGQMVQLSWFVCCGHHLPAFCCPDLMFSSSECSLRPFGSLRMGIQYLDVVDLGDRTIREELLGRRPAISFPLPFDLPFLLLPAAVAWTAIRFP